MLKYCYYTDNDLEKIKKAKNYKHLLNIAKKVIRLIRYNHPYKNIAMVCGPISTGGKGSRQENLKIFERAIDRLSGDGLVVFSQMPFEDDMDRIYKSDQNLQGMKLLEEFYQPIFESGFVQIMCFLPGWENSVGANWEHEQAKRLNIPRIYLSEYYVRD